MDYIVPPINLRGTFKLKPPLTNVINEKVIYTVDSIKTITNLIEDDVDVEKLIYIDQTLTSDLYFADLKAKVPIVTLKSEGNALFHIPASYFNYLPQVTGAMFINRAFIINMGYIPKDLDLTYLNTEIKDYITTLTGIAGEVVIEDISGDFVVSYAEADTFESDRIANVSLKTTCRGLLATANASITVYKLKIDTLVKQLGL